MKKVSLFFSILFSVIVFSSIPHNGVELTGFNRKDNSIEVKFNLPSLSFKEVKTKEGVFVKIDAGELGYDVKYGQAQLPTASFSLAVSGKPEVKVVSYKTEVIHLNHPVFPVQKPWPKSRRIEDRPFIFDKSYYEKEKTEFNLVSLGKTYIIHGQRGITITIHPFQYYPSKNTLVVYKEVILSIKGAGIVSVKTSPVYERMYSKVFLNYFRPDGKAEKGKVSKIGKILIITPSDYVDALNPFVAHKESMGYQVDVFTLDETGTTKEDIQNFIEQRYSLVSTRPDFLILVGDTDVIPAFRCSTADNPYTDLYYTTVDGDDYLPDIACGRFSVSSVQDLLNIINKTIYTEENLGSFEDKALFMTADDNYQITEGTHNYVIEKYFEPSGYQCEKLYAYTTGVSKQGVADAVNNGQTFVVYSGHGSPSGWSFSYSVSFTSYDVKNLLENTIYPFVYSFACQTGEYEYGECFAEAWIRVSHGATTFWGSSVYSYWDEDDILERSVFKAMFEDNEYQVGPMFNTGKIYLYNYYHGGGSTKRYFQQYNLFGDPSVFVKPYKPVSKGQLFLDMEAVSCSQTINVEVWDSDLTGDTLEIEIKNQSTGETKVVELNKTDEGKYSGSVSLSQLFGNESDIFLIQYHDSMYGEEGEYTLKKEVYMDCDSPFPVFFNAYSDDSTTGKVNVLFDELCATINIDVYNSNTKSLVKHLSFTQSSTIDTVIDGLNPDTEYTVSITAVDTVGNTYTQSGIKLFKTIHKDVMSFDDCSSEDNLSHGAITGNDVWSVVNSSYATSDNLCWYGKEQNSTTASYLIYGPIDIPSQGDYVFNFYHTFHLEKGYDGGMVELSVDGGNTYFDAGVYILSNGYNGYLQSGLYEGRFAFTGGEYGEMEKTVINLSPFKGQQVYVRFLLTCDSSVALSGGGWYIDDISVERIYPDSEKAFLVGLKKSAIVSLLAVEHTSVSLTLYDSSGSIVATSNIELNENSALHKKLSDLFNGVELGNGLYTMKIESDNKVAAFEMDDFTDERGDMRDWTEACYNPDRLTAPVPHIAPEIWYWDTYVQVANVSESPAVFKLAYSPLNTLIPFSEEEFNPKASLQFDVIDSIFHNQWPEFGVNMANIYAENDSGFLPVCATEVFRVKDKDNSCKLTLEQNTGTTLYVAHVDNSDYWWTGIALINPDRTDIAIVDVIPITADGDVLTENAKRYLLEPGERYAFVSKDEFPENAAWFEIDSSIPIMGYELFGTTNRKLLTGIDLISRPAAEVILPVVDSVNDWFGITIVNPSPEENKVSVKGYLNGEVVFEKEITLGSYSKWVGLLTDLYQGSVDMLKLDSRTGIVSFCLEGNGHDDSTMTMVGGVKGFRVY